MGHSLFYKLYGMYLYDGEDKASTW